MRKQKINEVFTEIDKYTTDKSGKADEEMVESLDLGGVEGLVNDAFRMVDGYRDDMTALLVEVEGIDI